MTLSDLPARELAELDAICLEFEAEIRSGARPSIEQYAHRARGQYVELLRGELVAIETELQQRSIAETTAPTDGVPGDSLADAPLSGAQSSAQRFRRNRATLAGDASAELPGPGSFVDHYRITGLLGRGGMGVVYEAIDERFGQTVAMKMLTPDSARRAGLPERFAREAKAVAALSHPNIVELFAVGEIAGLAYAVMEFLDGELFDERLARGPLAAAEVRRLGAQIADALDAAHQGGVIHRDLKPHNIMLVRDNDDLHGRGEQSAGVVVKLFDFGLSRVPRSVSDDGQETSEGTILGTPGYMAPEQVRGEPVTAAADLFSLGCILYESFYARRAFAGETSAERFRATIEQTPTRDRKLARRDRSLAQLIEHCLEKDAVARPAGAAEIAARLRQQ